MVNKIKLAVFLTLFVALSGVLCAQVEMRAMLEGAFIPYQYFGLPDDAEFGYFKQDHYGYYPNGETGAIRAGFGRSDGLGSYQAGVDCFGQTSSQNLGIYLQLRFRPTEGNVMAAGDNLKLWWKPIDMLQIDVGKFMYPAIGSKVNPPPYYHFYLPIGNENTIFQRSTGTGLLFQLTPLPDLYISAAIKADDTLGLLNNTGGFTVNRPLIGQEETKRIFERTQAAVAYTFNDVGLLRVQYFGRNADVRENENEIDDQIGKQALNSEIFGIQSPRIEAAFNLTVLSGLTLDLGGKIPLPLKNVERKSAAVGAIPVKIKGQFQEPYILSLGAKYLLKDFSFNGLFSGKLGGWLQYEEGAECKGKKWEIGPELQAVVWVTYKVIENLQLEIDFGTILNADTFYDNKLAIKGGSLFGGGFFGQFNIFGNNNWVRAGVSFSAGTLSGNKPVYGADPSPDKWFRIISIPIVFHAEL